MMRRLVLTLALLVGCGDGMEPAGTGGLSGDAGFADEFSEPLPEQVGVCYEVGEAVEHTLTCVDPYPGGRPMFDAHGVPCYLCRTQYTSRRVSGCLIHGGETWIHCVADCNECKARPY